VVNYEIIISLALGVSHALLDAKERWKATLSLLALGRSMVEIPDGIFCESEGASNKVSEKKL